MDLSQESLLSGVFLAIVLVGFANTVFYVLRGFLPFAAVNGLASAVGLGAVWLIFFSS